MAKKENTAEVKENTAEVRQDPWKVKKEIFLSKPATREAKSFYVAVNGRSFNIPYNKNVEVPLPIFEALRNAQALQAVAEERAEAMKLKPEDMKYL